MTAKRRFSTPSRGRGDETGSTLKRIGLKYCGGCDPSYDRVEYVRAIQEAAGDRIEWIPLDEGGFTTVMLVCGCDTQCVEMAEYVVRGCRIVRVKDGSGTPSQILSHLLEGDS